MLYIYKFYNETSDNCINIYSLISLTIMDKSVTIIEASK